MNSDYIGPTDVVMRRRIKAALQMFKDIVCNNVQALWWKPKWLRNLKLQSRKPQSGKRAVKQAMETVINWTVDCDTKKEVINMELNDIAESQDFAQQWT